MVEVSCCPGTRGRGIAHVHGRQSNNGAEQQRLLQGPIRDLIHEARSVVAEVILWCYSLDVVLEIPGDTGIFEGVGRDLSGQKRCFRKACAGSQRENLLI